MKRPTLARIKILFNYEPSTGIFIWKVNTSPHRLIGKQAGFIIPGRAGGYRRLRINGKTYAAAHVVWLWMAGKWPRQEIDHINGIRDDNRFINLREATRAENCRNKGSKIAGRFKGVTAEGKKWRAQLGVGSKDNRRNLYLGSYSTPEIAALMYDKAARKIHGEFARLNFPSAVQRDWLIV